MKPSRLVLVTFFGSALATGVAFAASSTGGKSDGAAGYTFQSSPLNSMGLKSLADLRGKPVLIDFWGRH